MSLAARRSDRDFKKTSVRKKPKVIRPAGLFSVSPILSSHCRDSTLHEPLQQQILIIQRVYVQCQCGHAE